jgi:hypothetical protein
MRTKGSPARIGDVARAFAGFPVIVRRPPPRSLIRYRNRSYAEIVDQFSETVPAAAWWPVPMRTVRRLLADEAVIPLIRGDGSRRRCAELRQGLQAYRHWLDAGGGAPPFAVYLFEDCGPAEYPVFDWHDLDTASLAYVPPPLVIERTSLLSLWQAEPAIRHGFSVCTTDSKPRRALQKRKRLHTGRVNRAVSRRLILGHRPQRMVTGERAPNVRVHEEDVLAIRRLYRSGAWSFARLGQQFRVSAGTIGQIVTGTTWRHLPLDPDASNSTPVRADAG